MSIGVNIFDRHGQHLDARLTREDAIATILRHPEYEGPFTLEYNDGTSEKWRPQQDSNLRPSV